MNLKEVLGGKKYNQKYLIISSLISFSVSFIAGFISLVGSQSEWYESIRGNISPSTTIFLIVWIALFITITLSLYYSSIFAFSKEKTVIAIMFAISLSLIVVWNYLFFGFREIIISLYASLILIISTIIIFAYLWKINIKSSVALIPYLLWTIFLGIVNYASYIKGIIN